MSEAPAPKTFCVLPWVHQFVNLGGEYQVCCTSEEYDNAIRDDSGRPFYAADLRSADAIYNSRQMRELRLALLRGQWPDICKRCAITEASGGHSRRQSENLKFRSRVGQLIESTDSTGAVPVNLMSMDYRLGNTCNLACRMCNPRASKKWIRDWHKIDQSRYYRNEDLAKEFGSQDWYKNDTFVELFKNNLKSATYLHFGGGEPLIIPEMKKLLRLCIDAGVASKIDLSYNTNLTKLDEELGELWSHFNSVFILVSVDGFGGINDYIRSFSTWSGIDANLRRLDENFSKWKIKEVMVSCTVQILNVFHLNELFSYMSGSFKNIDPIPQLIDLHYPHYYSVQVLPDSHKKIAQERLVAIKTGADRYLAAHPEWEHLRFLLSGIDATVNLLSLKDESGRLGEFFRANDSIDRLRGTRLENCSPIVGELRGSLKVGFFRKMGRLLLKVLADTL